MSLQFKKTVSLLAVIAVAALIFFFSAQPGEDSSALSGSVTELVLQAFVPGYADMTEEERQPYLDDWGYAVRKFAHFSEFALLAVTLVWHFHYTRPADAAIKLMLLAWVIATLYAGTDELHQMFVDARGPAITDVGIDSLGALTGAFAAAVVSHSLRKKAGGRSKSAHPAK